MKEKKPTASEETRQVPPVDEVAHDRVAVGQSPRGDQRAVEHARHGREVALLRWLDPALEFACQHPQVVVVQGNRLAPPQHPQEVFAGRPSR